MIGYLIILYKKLEICIDPVSFGHSYFYSVDGRQSLWPFESDYGLGGLASLAKPEGNWMGQTSLVYGHLDFFVG